MIALVLETALPRDRKGRRTDPVAVVLGTRFDENGVRLGLEDTYRSLARHSPVGLQRIAFVDRANAVRPRSIT